MRGDGVETFLAVTVTKVMPTAFQPRLCLLREVTQAVGRPLPSFIIGRVEWAREQLLRGTRIVRHAASNADDHALDVLLGIVVVHQAFSVADGEGEEVSLEDRCCTLRVESQ